MTAAPPPVFPWPTVSCAADARLTAARAAGVYSTATHRVVLAPYVCAGLGQLQSGAPLTDFRYQALFTLAHELAHASGIAGEREADCRAKAILAAVGRHLRLPAATVRAARAFLPGRCE